MLAHGLGGRERRGGHSTRTPVGRRREEPPDGYPVRVPAGRPRRKRAGSEKALRGAHRRRDQLTRRVSPRRTLETRAAVRLPASHHCPRTSSAPSQPTSPRTSANGRLSPDALRTLSWPGCRSLCCRDDGCSVRKGFSARSYRSSDGTSVAQIAMPASHRDSFEGPTVVDPCGPDALRLPCTPGGGAFLSAHGVSRRAVEDRRLDKLWKG